MDAKEFLKQNGVAVLTEVIVEENKFETLEDLQLLAENQQFLASLKIPVCWQMKFEAAIKKKLENGKGENKEQCNGSENLKKLRATPAATPVDIKCPINKEITKKQLLELSKSDMTAQSINIKYNELNKFILAEQKWKGAGALKKCDSTSEEDAKVNMKIADEIVDNPDVSKWYGTFTIGDHGVFTINRAKAKMLLEIAVDTLKKSSDMRNSREKDMYSDDDCSDTVLDKKPVGGKSKDNAKYLSPYELEKEKRVKENNLVLLKQNLISPSYASITALFYLKAKKLSDITVMSVKKQLTKLGVTFPKGQSYSREALVILLGKELFNKGKVKRIDETKVITKDNLTLTS